MLIKETPCVTVVGGVASEKLSFVSLLFLFNFYLVIFSHQLFIFYTFSQKERSIEDRSLSL